MSPAPRGLVPEALAPKARRIRLHGYELLVDIGFHSFEVGAPQRLRVDVDIWVDEASFPTDDQVKSAWNYDFLRETVKTLAAARRFNLQETFCRAVYDIIAARKGAGEPIPEQAAVLHAGRGVVDDVAGGHAERLGLAGARQHHERHRVPGLRLDEDLAFGFARQAAGDMERLPEPGNPHVAHIRGGDGFGRDGAHVGVALGRPVHLRPRADELELRFAAPRRKEQQHGEPLQFGRASARIGPDVDQILDFLRNESGRDQHVADFGGDQEAAEAGGEAGRQFFAEPRGFRDLRADDDPRLGGQRHEVGAPRACRRAAKRKQRSREKNRKKSPEAHQAVPFVIKSHKIHICSQFNAFGPCLT